MTCWRVLLCWMGMLACVAAPCGAYAGEFRVQKLTDGRYVLIASWPTNTDRLCFYEIVSTAPLGCTTAPVSMPSKSLTIAGQVVNFNRVGGTVGYVLTALSGDGMRQIKGYAENANGRSADSVDLFRIDLRPAPGVPQLLDLMDSAIDAQQRSLDSQRENVRQFRKEIDGSR